MEHHQVRRIGDRQHKDAAFAISAHTNRYGSGGTFALRTAARMAGVSTTAVASLDMKMVTSVPIAIDQREQPCAGTACAAQRRR